MAQTLRSDLYISVDTEASETILLKKIEITKKIEQLSKLQDAFNEFCNRLNDLSNRWNIYLDQKSSLPKRGLSELDINKIALLKSYFISNLQRYHYSSLSNFDGIEISEESLLPTIDGFDMKFDSSASDGIRTIWAYTLALLQVSIEKGGNHPGVIIFDEPAQQSIVSEDMKSFIASVVEAAANGQIITAITLNSKELVQIIRELDTNRCHRIQIKDRAFRQLRKER